MPRDLYEDFLDNLRAISQDQEIAWGNYYGKMGLTYDEENECHVPGVCFGLALMWTQAFLCNDMPTFYERIRILANPDTNALIYQIKKAIARQIPDFRKYLDIRAFLDGLLLYLSPEKTFLSSKFNVQTSKVSAFLIPEKLEKRVYSQERIHYDIEGNLLRERYFNCRPLNCIYSYPWAGTQDFLDTELNHIITTIRNILIPYAPFVVITFNSAVHCIALGIRCSDFRVELFDSNSLHDNVFTLKYSIEKVFDCFEFEQRDGILTLNIAAYISPAEWFPSLREKKRNRESYEYEFSDNEYERNQLPELDSHYSTSLEDMIATNWHITSDLVYLASSFNKISILKHLLARGANPDQATNYKNTTPLCVAAQNGYANVILQLLDAGANPDLTDSEGASPLFFAAQNSHTHVVDCLLRHGADPNLARDNGDTPLLMSASKNGHTAVFYRLLAGGANPNQVNKKGVAPLNIASLNGHTGLVDCLLARGVNPNYSDNKVAAPLILASLNGHADVVDCLLRYGADPNLPDKKGINPLMPALINRNDNMIKQLICHGANSNAMYSGRPVKYLYQGNNQEVIWSLGIQDD